MCNEYENPAAIITSVTLQRVHCDRRSDRMICLREGWGCRRGREKVRGEVRMRKKNYYYSCNIFHFMPNSWRFTGKGINCDLSVLWKPLNLIHNQKPEIDSTDLPIIEFTSSPASPSGYQTWMAVLWGISPAEDVIDRSHLQKQSLWNRVSQWGRRGLKGRMCILKFLFE